MLFLPFIQLFLRSIIFRALMLLILSLFDCLFLWLGSSSTGFVCLSGWFLHDGDYIIECKEKV